MHKRFRAHRGPLDGRRTGFARASAVRVSAVWAVAVAALGLGALVDAQVLSRVAQGWPPVSPAAVRTGSWFSRDSRSASRLTFSGSAVSASTERVIVATLASSAPPVNEVYIQRMRDGGLALFATADLHGYRPTYAVAASVAAQYLAAAFRDLRPYAMIDFANIYIASDGHYILAAGLGRAVAAKMASRALASDEGSMLAADLAHVNRFSGPFVNQAYAQYHAP